MRKNITILLCMPVLVVLVVVMTACGSVYDKYKNKISDFRDAVLTGATENYLVEVISGIREADFALDGVSGDKIDYTVITVNPLISVENVAINVTINNENYSVTCNKHPLGSTYSVEIETRFTGSSLDVTVNSETVILQAPFEPLTITANNALEIADAALGLETAQEVYVRIIDNPITADGYYYWYVATYNDEGTKAVLIDITTGEILAKR